MDAKLFSSQQKSCWSKVQQESCLVKSQQESCLVKSLILNSRTLNGIMETCRLIHQSPIPPNHHHHSRRRRRHHHQNVLRQPSTMPIRGPILALRRITTPVYHFSFNHSTEAFCITNQFSHHRMADGSKNKDVVQGKLNGEEKDKAPEKSTITIPPPPEKPLPGDCCGSGCVRCVWDLYYEELEEYNRLYNADPKVS